MQDPKDHLATTLKEIRKNKGLSLDALGKQTGVSKAMLGQIERGESSPTVSTLWKIATGLEVSLSTFIEPLPTHSFQAPVIRTADEIRQHPAHEGLMISPLFPYEKELGFEYLELTFEAGYEHISEPHVRGVVEITTVLEGVLEIYYQGKWHKLEKGQTMRHAGDKEHGYRNPSSSNTKIINVIHYPTYKD